MATLATDLCCCKRAVTLIYVADLVAGPAQAAALAPIYHSAGQLQWLSAGLVLLAYSHVKDIPEVGWGLKGRRHGWRGRRPLGRILSPVPGLGSSDSGHSWLHGPAPTILLAQIQAVPRAGWGLPHGKRENTELLLPPPPLPPPPPNLVKMQCK